MLKAYFMVLFYSLIYPFLFIFIFN